MTQMLRVSPSGPDLVGIFEPGDGAVLRRAIEYDVPLQAVTIDGAIGGGESSLGSECVFHVPNDPNVDVDRLIWRIQTNIRTASDIGCEFRDQTSYVIQLRTNPVGPVWQPIKSGYIYPGIQHFHLVAEDDIFQLDGTVARYWDRFVHPTVEASWVAGAEVAVRILLRVAVTQVARFAASQCHFEIAELYGHVDALIPPT